MLDDMEREKLEDLLTSIRHACQDWGLLPVLVVTCTMHDEELAMPVIDPCHVLGRQNMIAVLQSALHSVKQGVVFRPEDAQ